MELLDGLFGACLSIFFRNCDRDHPDLKTGEIADFLNKLDQIHEAALFCHDRGLSEPLEAIRNFAPKSHPRLTTMTRTLKERFRIESRSRKSFVKFDAGSILPSFIGSARTGAFDPVVLNSDDSARWLVAHERFSSIGCHRMAAVAKDLSWGGTANRIRLSRFPLPRAVASLCERTSLSHDGLFWVGPAGLVSLPSQAADAIQACESELDGFPAFDHYFLVAPASGDAPPIRLNEGFFVLGERDGECYFVFSD